MNRFEEWLQTDSCQPFYGVTGRSKSNFAVIKVRKNEKIDLLFGQKNKLQDDVQTSDFGFAGIYLPRDHMFYYVSRDFRKMISALGYNKDQMNEHNISCMAGMITQEIEEEIEKTVDNNKANLSISQLKDESYIYELAKLESHDTAARQAKFYFDQGRPISYIASYPGKKWSLDAIMAYIDDPKDFVQEYAQDYIFQHEEEILYNLLRNERINQEYQKLQDRKDFELPIARRFADELAPLNAKIVEVELEKNGRSIRFDMDGKIFDGEIYTYQPGMIIQPGRRNYLDLIGDQPFYPDEITAVYYKGKPVYKKPSEDLKPDLPVVEEETGDTVLSPEAVISVAETMEEEPEEEVPADEIAKPTEKPEETLFDRIINDLNETDDED